MAWTPERAIVFTMAFVNKPRGEASEICRRFGFDIPAPTADVFNRAHNAWLSEHGSLAGFYDAHPQFERPAVNTTPEQREAAEQLQRELDSVFFSTTNPEK